MDPLFIDWLIILFSYWLETDNSSPSSVEIKSKWFYTSPPSICSYGVDMGNFCKSDVHWTVHHCDSWRIKNQLDATCYFILLLIDSTCFGHYYVCVACAVCSARAAGWSTTSCASACSLDTTQAQPHLTSNIQQTKNKTTNVVIQQHSRKLLMMDIVMSETCWVYKK